MRARMPVLLGVLLAGCPKPEPPVDPRLQADGHYLAGQTAYLKGDFAEAHARFAEVKRLNPADPRLPAAEGEVYLAEAKLAEAFAAFEAAVKLDPRRATNWSRLGYLHSLRGDRAQARAALEKALGGNPRDFNALETMAELQLADGQLDEAVKSLLLASEAAPEGAQADLVLRAAAELEKAGRGVEAIAALEAAAKRGLRTPELLTELGDRLARTGRLEEALAAYTDAAKGNPKDPTLWELVGEVQVKLGRLAEAEAAFRESLRVKDRAVVHVALARLCQAGRDAGCLGSELDRALETASGEELRETLELADLLASLGRAKDAASLLRTLSEEPEQKGNVELQLKTARLAKELGDRSMMQAACARAGAGGHVGRCP